MPNACVLKTIKQDSGINEWLPWTEKKASIIITARYHPFTFGLDVLFTECRDNQTSSVKGQIVNIWGSVGHNVSVTTTQLCPCNMKAIKDNI